MLFYSFLGIPTQAGKIEDLCGHGTNTKHYPCLVKICENIHRKGQVGYTIDQRLANEYIMATTVKTNMTQSHENRRQLLVVLDILIQLKTRGHQILLHMIQEKEKRTSTTGKYVILVFRFFYPRFIFRLFYFFTFSHLCSFF